MTIIIGIDPGLNNTGYGVIDFRNNSYTLLASGVIKTNVQDNLSDRLLTIHMRLQVVLQQYKPDVAAIECTYVNSGAASSIKLAHARSAAMLTLKIAGITVDEYQAKTIKKTICGSGAADKAQMIGMLNYLMPNTKIKNADEADAISVAICHGFYYRHKAA